MHIQSPTADSPSAVVSSPVAVRPAERIIADRGEFVDVLRRLRQGHVLVRPRAAADSEQANSVLDGCAVYTAFQPLLRFGLLAEFDNPQGFAAMRYFRLTSTGKRFADKALRAWAGRPLLERLGIRLLG